MEETALDRIRAAVSASPRLRELPRLYELYSHADFGNAVMVLGGRNICLRLVEERNEHFAEVSRKRQPWIWHSVQRVLRATRKSAAPLDSPLALLEAIRLLETELEALEIAFSKAKIESTESQLAALAAGPR